MTQVSIMQNVRGLHLNQRYLKSGKKRLSYGQFTKGRLHDPDPSEYHAKCKRSIKASFEPKRSTISKEMAELWPTTNGRSRDCSEYHAGLGMVIG